MYLLQMLQHKLDLLKVEGPIDEVLAPVANIRTIEDVMKSYFWVGESGR
jgi:hypothetical protein